MAEFMAVQIYCCLKESKDERLSLWSLVLEGSLATRYSPTNRYSTEPYND